MESLNIYMCGDMPAAVFIKAEVFGGLLSQNTMTAEYPILRLFNFQYVFHIK